MVQFGVLALLLGVDAPVTAVTIFTDQARVVRTASAALSGVQDLEFPLLPDTVDTASIRVEASGAEVRRVELERVVPTFMQAAQARELLQQRDTLDLELERLNKERSATIAQRDALLTVTPAAVPEDPHKPAPRLNPSGWAASQGFLAERVAALQQRVRELEAQVEKRERARDALLEKEKKSGDPATRSGWKVTAVVSGNGPATLTCSYLVTRAHWTPTWDLQLRPEKSVVSLALAGLVAQETSEDWTHATLRLSTAVPSSAVKAPVLSSWKVGTTERFIPTSQPRDGDQAPTPPEDRPARPSAEPAEPAKTSGVSVLLGVVSGDGRLLADAVVTLTSPALAGDAVVVSDLQGRYRVSSLPAGVYTVKVERAGFDPFSRGDFTVRADRTVRMNVDLRRSADRQTQPGSPVVDVGSTSSGVAVGKEFVNNIAFVQPDSKQNFEGLARRSSPVKTGVSLSPPPAWRPPDYGPDSPVTLAGGADLVFDAVQKETIPSGSGARRVPLWSAEWPVTVERKLFPALTPDVFLVAELKNPSQQTLPGGPAQLAVGADPSGQARLQLVSPGETFTLPLGIDHALRPLRSVQLVEETKGLINQVEVGTYTVTIELANPSPTPIAVRVADQWPLSAQKEVEVKLVETKPAATQDPRTGWLEWRATIAGRQTAKFSFVYTLTRPKGWRLSDSEVAP